MIQDHLHILHLNNTGDDKTDRVCNERYGNLMEELINQNITNYTIWDGYYDPKNTKQAIHKGHRRIVQYAKDNNLTRVVLAEDDIKFTHPNSYNYFISQIPKSYDIFSGLVYQASMKGNRIMNGGSGLTSLYVVNQRHYDRFLAMDVSNHVDRESALTAFENEYLVCEPMVCEQRGGYSFNRKQRLFYSEYLRDKKLYGVEDNSPNTLM